MGQQAAVAVLGAGAFAGVTIHTLRDAGFVVEAVFDDAKRAVAGIEVTGKIADYLPVCHELQAIIGIGDNTSRKRIAALVGGDNWLFVKARQATVFPDTTLGLGSIVVAGAVIEQGVTIGRHAIIDSCAEVAHDCVIGNFVHVSANATLGGSVGVGEGALLGLGCVVLPGVLIGEWVVIGAGAVVLRDVPPCAVMVGNPARLLKYREVPT